MSEITIEAYDPIPDLAWLLGAAQRQAAGIDTSHDIAAFARRLGAGLRLRERAWPSEIEAAIRNACAAHDGT